MRSLLISGALLGLLTVSPLAPRAAQAAPPPPAAPSAGGRVVSYTLKVDKLENGLTVARVPFSSPGLVAFYTAVRVGSRNEVEPGHTGFAHFFEHMMFKGTPRYPEGIRESALSKLGFSENAFTTDDFTVYHVTGPSSALAQVIDFEADRFANLEYPEPVFQTEAKAILGEYHKSAARPELKMEEALLAATFKSHTYRHTTLGFYEDIKKMPEYYAYSKQFFERWYTPDNTTLYIVGDFDDAKVMELVKAAYGPWKRKSAQVTIPVEPPQREQRVVELSWSEPTLPRLVFAYRTPAARVDKLDAAIQGVLQDYLIGPTSDLHKQLVLEKQQVEQLGSWYYDHRDPFLFTLSASLREEKHRDAVKKAFDKAIRALATGKVDAKRVEAIKSNARYAPLMALETPGDLAGRLAWYGSIYGDPNAFERYLENVAKVTPRHLIEFAKQYFVARNRTLLHLVPKTTAAKTAAGVKK